MVNIASAHLNFMDSIGGDMKKSIANKENPNGIGFDMTA